MRSDTHADTLGQLMCTVLCHVLKCYMSVVTRPLTRLLTPDVYCRVILRAMFADAGPWRRLDAPVFGPCDTCWDDYDVSNPAPILLANGSVVLLYKGRGRTTQVSGCCFIAIVFGMMLLSLPRTSKAI